MAQLREEFVPLHNFQPGDVNFNNTCFIAVVANLRHVLQPVMDVVRQYTWNEYINHVRSNWNGKYRVGEGHNGQHDAAELLGDIIHCNASRSGVELYVSKVVYECNHCIERVENLSMIVLTLPSRRGRFTLRSLRDDYFAPVEVSELRCEECGVVDSSGLCTHTYKRSLSGKIVFRINRYGVEGRRSDPVTINEKLILRLSLIHI